MQPVITTRRRQRTACLFLLLLTMSSCYSYRLQTHAQPGTQPGPPNVATANAYFWGLIQKPATITTPLCDSLGSSGVSEVVVKTNFGYALITVVTLGIWCPMRVEWRCAKPGSDGGGTQL